MDKLQVLEGIGLPKNEARIYEILLGEGQSSVGGISKKSGIHRRNVYDSLDRLSEKGLVFQVIGKHDSVYKPVDPRKLEEMASEKQKQLERIMPELRKLYGTTPKLEEVFIYKGIEGFKNFLRDALEVGEDIYSLGAKGAWFDPRLEGFLEDFLTRAKEKGIRYKHLFDYEVREQLAHVPKAIGKPYKYLPKKYSTPSMIDFFGDRVVLFTGAGLAKIDDDITLFVIISQPLALSMRTWFECLYDLCPEVAEGK